MSIKFNNIFFSIIFFIILFTGSSKAEVVKKIDILGNYRITSETIKMFSSINLNDDLDENKLNQTLKNLYETNFFDNVSLEFDNNILIITVVESPIIQNITYDGIKAKKIKDVVFKNLSLRPRTSFNEVLLKSDKEIIQSSLRNLGYYFSKIDIYKETFDDNKVNLTYTVNLGKKAKIKKILFIGNKIFKERLLKNIIISEEYKPWKFISGKKFLNQNVITIDKRLLKNFYLNKGYYDVKINSSFARRLNENDFELIFNIDTQKKFFFNNLTLEIPSDFDDNNFNDLLNLFAKLKGEAYTINKVENILEEIDKISTTEQFESISSSVQESFEENKINLKFIIEETEKMFIQKINIYGNNITRENVIRNQLEIDEGDPFNEILNNKSINNIKSLNFFKSVESEIVDGTALQTKIININVKEKPTGEISAGAGVGTSGGTVSFGVREQNYLGKGLSVSSNLSINEESIRGLFSVTNPNYKNSNKSVYVSAQALETDKLSASGYKTSKSGFSFGTNFEYLKNLSLGLGTTNFYEKIDTDSTASARQKLQDGNYWDSFINLSIDYDERNQKFQTTEGFRSSYYLDLPVISETNTLTNLYHYKMFSELYENNVSSLSFYVKSSTSLSDEVKLSERIFLPGDKLRGFERGKIGPKDGDDFIGGNFASAINFSSTVPQILQNSQNIDFLFFIDAANVWGVDYFDGDDEGSEIRSSLGIGINWLTPIGPLSFTLAEPLTKSNTDKTESFRFNLGTTF